VAEAIASTATEDGVYRKPGLTTQSTLA
jgi:hypothetical protein